MKIPEISVLTCCYNASTFVKEAIESILQQAYQDFEYVIVDDGSTDNTLDILRECAVRDNRIVVIEKKHSGFTDSLNVGLGKAKGKWIARLDADDIAMPDRLQNQIEFMQNNDGVVLLGGGCIEIEENGMGIRKHIYPQNHNALMCRMENGEALFPHSSAFFHKEYITELGGYNPRFLRSQDWDLWLRIGETAKIACLQVPVVKLRKHHQMISKTDGGKLQAIMGLSAMVCHYRRRWGITDPSRAEESIWRKFLKWIQECMEGEDFFQLMQGWQDFRNRWYSNSNFMNKIEKRKSALVELIGSPFGRKLLWKRFQRDNFALRLAKESRELFH